MPPRSTDQCAPRQHPPQREPGPLCPPAGCPSENPRPPGRMATWSGGPFDRTKFHRPRAHAPPGCRRCVWSGNRGYRFARPPAHFGDPKRVGVSQAPGGLMTTSRVKGPLCPPLGVHPNTTRSLGPRPASREPGPLCPPAGCPSENRRAPERMARGSAGHSTPRNFIGHAFTHHLRGAGRGGGGQPGVFASLDPRLISVTPSGVGMLSAPGRD
jgi:hypothetical protein